MIKCCKDCEKRQIGCHSKCEDYISEKEDANRVLEKKRAEDKFMNDFIRIRERRYKR